MDVSQNNSFNSITPGYNPNNKSNKLVQSKIIPATSNLPISKQNIIYTNKYQSMYLPGQSNIQYPYVQGVTNVQQTTKSENGYKKLKTFDVPFLDKGHLYELDNKQKVVIIPKEGATTIKSFAKVGSFNEGKTRGISHYIEHNLFNGSKNLKPNQFVEDVTSMGGLYNASTDTADTDYFIYSPLHKEGDLNKFLKMHADMLMNPEFSEKMLEKEKGPVISEIQMYEDDPYDKAYNTMIKNLFGIKADYQGLIAGSAKGIQNITRKEVVDYYNEWYRPENMLTVVVGDVDPDKTINMVSNLFNKKKNPPVSVSKKHYYEPLKVTDTTKRKDFKSNQIDSVCMAMGIAGPKNNDTKESIATTALAYALAGYENARLQTALKPLNSSANTGLSVISSDYNAPQVFSVDANFAPGTEEEGLKTIYKTLHEMKQKPVSEKELSVVKGKIKDNLTRTSESSMGIARLVGSSIVDHGDLGGYTDMVKEVDRLTPKDIQNAAQKHLNLNKASIVMIHPESEKIEPTSSKKVGFSGNSDKFKLNHIKEYNLPNNLHVAINDNPNSIRTSAQLKVKSDSPQTLKPGVADVLTRMMAHGTKNYSEEQLNEIIDSNNLGVQSSIDVDAMNFAASCPKEKLPMALGVMKEMLYNTDLTQEKLEKAKKEVKVIYSSIPKSAESRAIETLYPDHPNGITVRKVLKGIDKVTLKDVKDLQSKLVSNSQGVMTIDGPISKTPGLGNQVFMQLQSGMAFSKPYHAVSTTESKPLTENKVIAEIDKRKQADIVQIFKIKESGNIKDLAAIGLLNEVLGGNSMSRLFTDLRETQKLAYRVKSKYDSDGKYGNLKLSIKTTTDDTLKGPEYKNVEKSLDGFKKHLNLLQTTPLTEKEMEMAKLEVKTDIAQGIQTSLGRSQAMQNGFNTLYGAKQNNELIDAIEKLTPKDIQKAAKLYLSQPSVISLIASPDTIKNEKEYLSKLGKLEVINDKK